MAVVLDPGFIGVHAFCGDVVEVPIRQASGLPTVLDLEREHKVLREWRPSAWRLWRECELSQRTSEKCGQ